MNPFHFSDDPGTAAFEPRPLGTDALDDLPAALAAAGVELRSLPRLSPLKPVWRTTLHASGIRTRNAVDWGPPGWEHSGGGPPSWLDGLPVGRSNAGRVLAPST